MHNVRSVQKNAVCMELQGVQRGARCAQYAEGADRGKVCVIRI